MSESQTKLVWKTRLCHYLKLQRRHAFHKVTTMRTWGNIHTPVLYQVHICMIYSNTSNLSQPADWKQREGIDSCNSGSANENED